MDHLYNANGKKKKTHQVLSYADPSKLVYVNLMGNVNVGFCGQQERL